MSPSFSLQPFARLYEQHGRKLPPVVMLLLVIVIAWLGARLVWALVPTPQAARWQPPQLPAGPNGAARQADLQGIVNEHLFGAYQPQATDQNAAEAPETRLSLTLMGILADSNDGESRALIGASGGDEKPYAIGDDVIRGVSLQAIFPDRVVLSRNGTLETLRLNKEAPTTGTAPVAANSVSPGTAQMLTQIRDQVLADPAKASQFIRVRPANIDGKLAGFRVYPGRERGAFNQIGLRPGDLVTAVNGIQLDDSQKALQMLTQLSKANNISLTVKRGGQTQNFNVNLN
ncbi:type II secretion system protein GspC [Solimonas marina]|uniref:Type II secretion system protein GspC n=1 Tax=Solimonas marina TaxID=2714601 RepID=A0A969WAK3_9GAMM|nr:type II secretion system protein GspC [Solimonas marina]NKF22488.1 type II secretion system protein GspC [Solimonas marina]